MTKISFDGYLFSAWRHLGVYFSVYELAKSVWDIYWEAWRLKHKVVDGTGTRLDGCGRARQGAFG